MDIKHSPIRRPLNVKSAGRDQNTTGKTERKANDNGLLDRFKSEYDKLDIHLDQPEYQGISRDEAALMLGHFTQTMQNQGNPWKIHSASDGKKGFTKGKEIGDLPALKRLENGEPVLFQPMRDMAIDLSSGSFTALAAAGSVASADVTNLSRVAAYSKGFQGNSSSQGLTLKNGEPIVISSYSELKLLHQMHKSGQKIEGKSETAKAAQQLSFFTQKTVNSNYPWRFYVKDDSNVIGRVAKKTIGGAATGAGVGAIVAGAIGGAIAFATKDLSWLYAGAGIGAAVGGVTRGYQAAQSSSKGTPINAVDAMERVLDGKEVVFQEARVRSVPVPFLKQVSWYTDNGAGSAISSVKDLNTFYHMQSQDELPKAKKEEKKTPPQTIIIDRSVHHHYSDQSVQINEAAPQYILR